jgi:hypothetical protein
MIYFPNRKENDMADKPLLSRPKDKTLQAFKEWMKEIGDKLLPKDAPRVMTEKDWERLWKEFWSEADTEISQSKPKKKTTKPSAESKPRKKKPTRVQFAKDSTARQIVEAIRNAQDEWAKKYPKRAHSLYPKTYDENGKRINPDK